MPRTFNHNLNIGSSRHNSCILFKKSLSSDIFSELWNTPYVILIYKNVGKVGKKKLEYKLIFLISLNPKLVDSIVSDFLNDAFKITIISQHVFLGRSIPTNCLVYCEYITCSLVHNLGMNPFT